MAPPCARRRAPPRLARWLVLTLTLGAQARAAGGFVAAKASGDDGHRPVSAIDGDLDTYWACQGSRPWLRADLGDARTVDAVDIAWLHGDAHTRRFTLALSTNGITYTRVFSGASSGTTSAMERYTFAPRVARYVRITVLGDAPAESARISELAVAPLAPEPDPELGKDPFGVTMLYPDKVGGEQWFLAENATGDGRFDPQGIITRNADGSWKMRKQQVRMGVFTSTGYDAQLITTYDRDVLAGRGYMQAPNDWKNVEMTGFVKLNSTLDPADNFDWYARGGKHNDLHLGCEGSSYKAGLHFDGRARWQKETWHVSYEQTPFVMATTSLLGRWVGLKAVMRNVPVSTTQLGVRLEMYVNETADGITWKKVYDLVDDGGWGGDAQHCGGTTAAMPITWGGPIATFRWDNALDVDFKWLSVREIQP
ncbi:carbohydrate-binding protein [Corallococcus sp. H22C18031201]|nr:discoidin domain-containing protein [Citreicoccus inhibens]RJS24234.1 carbohydrate-binding protein [Corallococcus sp. H22C18031201]